jgi:hypothetical protein
MHKHLLCVAGPLWELPKHTAQCQQWRMKTWKRHPKMERMVTEPTLIHGDFSPRFLRTGLSYPTPTMLRPITRRDLVNCSKLSAKKFRRHGSEWWNLKRWQDILTSLPRSRSLLGGQQIYDTRNPIIFGSQASQHMSSVQYDRR